MPQWEIIAVVILFMLVLAEIARLLRSVCNKLDTINRSLQELKRKFPW